MYIHLSASVHRCANSAERQPSSKNIPLLEGIRLLGEVVDSKAKTRKTENESGISPGVRK